jgi:adenine-specific DNA-methyltransferase
MNKLKLHTPDLTAANIDRIAALFPNCVTEAKDEKGQLKRAIDFDLLKQELSPDLVDGPQERYRLDWPGKREALALANQPIAKTLRPCREESVEFENTQNLYIEGDNLDALKLLQETYLGKVKMIYIDPPYNTGNDFIYDDDYSMSRGDYEERSGDRDEEGNTMFDAEKWKQNSSNSGRFHSEWLSMIYPRLKLARNLLREDGVLFISIDDNELDNLLKCCSEILGAENHIGTVAVISNLKGRSDDKHYATAHNYLVAFQRNHFESIGLPMPDEYLSEYPEKDSEGRSFRLQGLRKRGDSARKEDRPLMHYPFFVNPDNLDISLEPKPGYSAQILPYLSDGHPGRWRWGKETSKKRISELVCKTVGSEKRLDIFQIDYAENEKGMRRVKPKSVWSGPKFSNEAGSLEVKKLFDQKTFDTPKPVGLLIECLEHSTYKDSLILDFFSGSATTAHAVMQLNAEDGGKRRHIMVQLPEPCDAKSEAFKAGYKTIAEIGKERIRRAGKKILQEWQAKQAKEQSAQHDLLHSKSNIQNSTSPPDIGFRVLKIADSNFRDIQRRPDELDQKELALHTEHIKPDRTPEDLLFQVLVDWGVDLALPIISETLHGKQVFFVDDTALAACFDTGVSEELFKAIAARKPLRAVFRDEGYGDDSTRINVEQIFKLLSPATEVKSL